MGSVERLRHVKETWREGGREGGREERGREERRKEEKERIGRRRRRRGKEDTICNELLYTACWERGREEGGYLSISVSSMLTSWLPRSRDSKMASHSSKKRIASLILASRKMNLKFSPAEKLPSEGKLMRRT